VTGRGPHIPAIARSVLQAVDGVGQPLTLVAHSGAGALAPAVVATAPDAFAAAVFVDATLPYPGRSWFESAPADLGDRLRVLADHEGVLPPWHTWFGPDAIAELVPDPATRAALCADIPRVPLSYLAETAPTELGWQAVPTCYLRLSDAYLDAEAVAAGKGWPTATLPDAHHLSGYTEPGRVVTAVESLLDELRALT
jgi:pimeloyl-ACP methyl ester carboxylesterase